MNKIWNRETLRFVDAWACRDGTPEDDEDALNEGEKAAAPQDAETAPPHEGLMPV